MDIDKKIKIVLLTFAFILIFFLGMIVSEIIYDKKCEVDFYDGNLAVCKNGDVVERTDSFDYRNFKEVL